MNISIIVAVADNWVIGKKNALPWYLPADLKHFKEITTGHHIIMGQNTFKSIGRPLPNRTNIVLSTNPNFSAPGITVAHSPKEALQITKDAGESEAMIIGGGMVYKTFVPLADKVYVTRVRANIEGDIFFPELSLSEWKLESSEPHSEDEKNVYNYDFQVWKRISEPRI